MRIVFSLLVVVMVVGAVFLAAGLPLVMPDSTKGFRENCRKHAESLEEMARELQTALTHTPAGFDRTYPELVGKANQMIKDYRKEAVRLRLFALGKWQELEVAEVGRSSLDDQEYGHLLHALNRNLLMYRPPLKQPQIPEGPLF